MGPSISRLGRRGVNVSKNRAAVIRSVETAPRTLRLSPMIGDSGFHYGADVTLPDDTIKLTLTLGVATLKTMGPAARRFAKPVTLSFDWE